jgi:signal recognition particle receptor subunit beta
MTPDSESVVIRLVYDGPPFSGKTTSLTTLAAGMARSVFSIADDAGRTLYFDWLEYVGGSFEGNPIRCQIVSVPGQAELADRRRALLAEADAVVFVLNSTPGHLAAAADHLRDLRIRLAESTGPRPGVVVQANYRDQADALPLADVRAALDAEDLALVESVATENQGIREAFVLSVRLALDRVREQLRHGRPPEGCFTAGEPASLLARLQDPDLVIPPRPISPPEPPPSLSPKAPADLVPRLPDSGAPIGQVWPPVEGRSALHSAFREGAVPRPGRDGSWRCQVGDWHFYSAARHELESLDDALRELLTWAQLYAGSVERLSRQRCVALAETGWGTWRLWQVVRLQLSLRQELRAALREAGPAGLARRLPDAAARLVAAREDRATPLLPCGLDLIGEAQGELVYTGFLPPPGWQRQEEKGEAGATAFARREARALVETARKEEMWNAAELEAALRPRIPGQTPAVAAILTAILDAL